MEELNHDGKWLYPRCHKEMKRSSEKYLEFETLCFEITLNGVYNLSSLQGMSNVLVGDDINE